MLHPMRRRILEELAEAGSAAELARRIDLPRQKVNYHLRELEREGLVELVEERRKGNCVERVVRATARWYVISPEVLGALGSTPAEIRDRFSSTYLIALAAGVLRDVATLQRRASNVDKRLATLSLQADVRFGNPEDRNAFAEELANEFSRLISKYHNDEAPDGRSHRFIIGAHPTITKSEQQAQREEAAYRATLDAGEATS